MMTPLDVPLVQFGRQVRRPRAASHAAGNIVVRKGCRAKGWNRAGYTLPEHEVFQATWTAADFANLETTSYCERWMCIPTVSNTVSELAKIYAGLVRDKDED